MINCAMLIDEKLAMGPEFAGLVLSIGGGCSVLGGVLYALCAKGMRQHILWIGAAMLGIGTGMQVITYSFVIFVIGAAIANFAFALVFTGAVDIIPRIVSPKQISICMGVIMAAQALGSMLTPYLINPIAQLVTGVSTGVTNYQVSVVWCVVVVIYAMVWGIANKRHYKSFMPGENL
jgi:predicted MFS family arabinose efflux permease